MVINAVGGGLHLCRPAEKNTECHAILSEQKEGVIFHVGYPVRLINHA